MKTLKNFIFIFAIVALMPACSDDEVNTKQASKFTADKGSIFVEQDKDNSYPLTVELLNPAAENLSVPVRVTKNTRVASFYIGGATLAVNDVFNITIPKGETKASVDITVGSIYYNTYGDTLSFQLVDPTFGGSGSMTGATATNVYISTYCSATTTDLQSLIGEYRDMDVDLTYKVSSVSGDTLVIEGLSYYLMYVTGFTPIDNYSLKFVVNTSAKPMTLLMPYGQPFFVTPVGGADAIIWARSTTSNNDILYSTLSFCDKRMTLQIVRYIPNQSSQAAWVINMIKK